MTLLAQHKVHISVMLPTLHRNDAVYVIGQFNNWQPGEKYRMHREKDYANVVLENVPAGPLEFKFTRKGTNTVECSSDGRNMPPHSFFIKSDTTISCEVAGWRDDFKANTATKGVKLMDSAFYMRQLNERRAIWIYLPKGYDKQKTRYPVLYMHDGRDIFDEATSQGRLGGTEWLVDETLDSAKKQCIVVAIAQADINSTRLRDYFVNGNSKVPDARGNGYLAFIVNTLKPYIDKHYKTLPDKEHTYMAGSSMGGLLSFNAGLLYPDVFGAIGALSPSFWMDEGNTEKHIAGLAKNDALATQRYFLYGGALENRRGNEAGKISMVENLQQMAKMLHAKTNAEVKIDVNPTGHHGAFYWQQAFRDFYKWLVK